MKLNIRSNEDEFVIYRETKGVLVYSILLAIACLGFGVTFINLYKISVFFLIFGIFFLAAGAIVLWILPRYYKKLTRDGGAVLLAANSEGLTLAPNLNMQPVTYSWSDVARILLTKRFVSKETGEKGLSKNQAIIYFRTDEPDTINLLQRSKQQIWKSPKGENVTFIDCPKDELQLIHDVLKQLIADKVDLYLFASIEFNYVSNSETFQPSE